MGMSRSRRVVEVETGFGVRGEVDGEENTVLANMYAVLMGLLLEANVAGVVVDTGGATITLRTAGDVSAGVYDLCYGTGTAPESLPDYTLTGLTCVTPTRAYTEADSETYIVATHTPGAAFSEVGIRGALYDTAGNTRPILLTRKVMSVAAGREVRARIVVGRPWVRSFWRLLNGVLTNTNQPARNIGGVDITLRSSGDVNAGPVRLIYTGQPVTWSPDLYSLPGAIELPTERYTVWDRRFLMLSLIGRITPPEPVTIRALGLVQSLFDTGGTAHDVLLAAYPLPEPATLEANKAYSIMWRLVAI